ncbi:MAG: DUF2007 domain-containing protein [Anaerolineae bacterium]
MAGHKTNRPGLVTVYTAFGQLEAHVIKTKLESAGIPALLDYESAGVVLGITVDGLGEVRVMVPEDLAQEAEELLSQPPDWPPDVVEPQTSASGSAELTVEASVEPSNEEEAN